MKRIVFLWALLAVGCTRSAFDSEQQGSGLLVSTTGSDWHAYVASQAGLIEEPRSVGRATESRFQPKDQIGIFLYSGSLAYQSTNMRYFTQDGTPEGSTTAPKWLAGDAMGGRMAAGTTYYGVAYYPYQAGVTDASAVGHTVATDQSVAEGKQATALERSDFLWAAPVKVVDPTSSPAVGLTFAHAMTKMVINLDVPMVIDGYPVSKANSLSIRSVFRSCTVDLRTGAVGNLGDEGDITPRLLSGDLLPGKRSVWEAMVVPQDLDVNHALISIKCETSAGEKTVNYMPPGSGLTLVGGTKVTFMLTSSADLAITSELDLFTGEAETLPLKVKTTSGTPWTLTSSQPSWLTLSTGSSGTFGASVSGTGTGSDQTVYVKTVANTGGAAISRDAVLTLSATLAGQVRSVTYRAVQNYSVPVNGFPTKELVLPNSSIQFPVVKGNSKWYIKASSPLPKGLAISTRNVTYQELTPADIVDVYTPTKGFEVLGNYFNTGGVLYAIADGDKAVMATVKCNGVDVVLDSRSTAITMLNPTTLQYETVHWAKGNLIASGARGKGGLGAAKVGDATDGGLYFQFGSLIGWKGGNQNNAVHPGNGVGVLQPPFNTDGYYWDEQNVKWPGWEVDSYLWPTEMGDVPSPSIAAWPTNGSGTTFNKWYFSYNQAPWDQDDAITSTNIRDFAVPIAGDKNTGTLATGRYAALGVGDPCSYYLGSDWRQPFRIDIHQLNGCVSSPTPFGELTTPMSCKGRYNSILGVFFGASAWGLPNSLVNNIFIPTVGRRFSVNGAIRSVSGNNYIYSASVYSSSSVYILVCDNNSVHPLYVIDKSTALPVRCVRL